MKHDILIGQVDYSVLVFIPDAASTDGSGKTGLVAANLTAGYTRVETDNDVVHTDGTSSLNDLALLTTAHADWGLKEVSSSLAPGLYRLDLPDGVFASGAWSAVVYVMVTTSAAAASPMEFTLIGFDKQASALPANVTQFGGSNGTFSGGRPEVNASHAAGTAWGSGAITAAAIAADAITAAKIADGAIDAATFAAGAINAAAIASDAITDAKVASDVTIASVTGAVGSVTGAVGSVASGGITAASFAANAINAAKLDPDVTTELQTGLATSSALGTAQTAITAIKTVTDLLPDGGALTSLGAEIDDILAALSMHSGTAQAGAAGTITLDTGASSVNDYYNDALVLIRSGTGVGQVRHISDYVGATRVATIKPNWITTPDNTSVFRVLPETSHWDHVLADHQDAGSMGETTQAILLDTAEIGTAGAGLTNIDLPNQTMNITGNLSGSVGSVTGAVGSVTAGVTLAASAVQAIWDALTSALTTVGSIGKLLVDRIDAAISSRSSQVSVDDLPTNAELVTSQAAADDATLAAIAALNNLSAAQVNAEVDTALVDIHLDHLLAVDYDPASKPGVATALLNELVESDAGVSRYTANALEQAPTGGSAPTVGQIADAVWDETLADHLGAGSTGAGLNAAGSAGDPWATAIPGAYGAGTAGKIVGDNVNATVGSRATQTSVDDLPTNAELTTALGTADDAVLAAVAALNNLSAANIRTAVGLATANLDTQLGDLPTNSELATALGTADDAVLAAVAALNNLSAAGVRTAVGLATANLDTQLDALPTAAEVWVAGTRTLTAATNITSTGGTTVPQTGDIFARLGAPAGASVSADLAAIEAQTDDIGAAGAGLTALATAANLATVDTVVDSLLALLVDARSEPGQGAPAATEDPLTKLDFLYKLARNRITQTATELKIYADNATTVDHKAVVSDDGTTYDRAEIGTGP